MSSLATGVPSLDDFFNVAVLPMRTNDAKLPLVFPPPPPFLPRTLLHHSLRVPGTATTTLAAITRASELPEQGPFVLVWKPSTLQDTLAKSGSLSPALPLAVISGREDPTPGVVVWTLRTRGGKGGRVLPAACGMSAAPAGFPAAVAAAGVNAASLGCVVPWMIYLVAPSTATAGADDAAAAATSSGRGAGQCFRFELLATTPTNDLVYVCGETRDVLADLNDALDASNARVRYEDDPVRGFIPTEPKAAGGGKGGRKVAAAGKPSPPLAKARVAAVGGKAVGKPQPRKKGGAAAAGVEYPKLALTSTTPSSSSSSATAAAAASFSGDEFSPRPPAGTTERPDDFSDLEGSGDDVMFEVIDGHGMPAHGARLQPQQPQQQSQQQSQRSAVASSQLLGLKAHGGGTAAHGEASAAASSSGGTAAAAAAVHRPAPPKQTVSKDGWVLSSGKV